MEVPSVALWAGRPITEMTQPELVDVVNQLARMLEQAREDHARTLRIWNAARMARSRV